MKNYTVELESSLPTRAIFEKLLDVKKWWSGVYDESINGKSKKVNDEFTFTAGGGMHFSKQQLREAIPSRKIVWEVTESNLSFLKNPKEWEKTKLRFDIIENATGKTKIIFTHEGLMPQIECYDQCSNGWSQYFKQLKKTIDEK